MTRSPKRSDACERPVTFDAAEKLGAFDLAQLWVDRTAWPIEERTARDELAELATMSALATWLERWLPVAIHGAMLAGAKPQAVAGALGSSLQDTYDRWHEWASHQRDIFINGKPGITGEEYETVTQWFGSQLSWPGSEPSPEQRRPNHPDRRCQRSRHGRQRRSR